MWIVSQEIFKNVKDAVRKEKGRARLIFIVMCEIAILGKWVKRDTN